MNNIVEKYTKIDLHIHSEHSVDKDGLLVSNGTKNNIGSVLVPKLEKSKVNMAAITDHNSFSFDFYNEFKKYSNIGGNLLKVLPGVELDIDVEDSKKDTHAIAIFDDSNEDKVKNIETIIEAKKSELIEDRKISKKDLLFKPADVIDLFRKIGLSFVLIVHQKADPCNENAGQEHNLAELGIDKFNELVSYDYFDAIEFKSYKVEGFLATHQYKYGKEYNSLCGSDCHEWNYYPKHDKDDKNIFSHCFIDALPTFKGLAMALTGDNRIHFSDLSLREPYLKTINFITSGKAYSLNLSPRLNVLIGDNSIGKSFFLESLCNPDLDKENVNDTVFSKKLPGYKSFKTKMGFSITSNTLENDSENVAFHRQGHIRSLFEGDSKSIEDQPFLSKYFGDIDTQLQETIIKRAIDDFVLYEEIISEFKKAEAKAKNCVFTLNPNLNATTYTISPLVDKETADIKNYKSIVNAVLLSKTNLVELINNPLVDKDDVKVINEIIKAQEKLIKKYRQKSLLESLKETIYSIVVEKVNKKKEDITKKSTEIDRLVSVYKKERTDFAEIVASFLLASLKNSNNILHIPDRVVIDDVEKPYDKYRFVSKVKKGVITRDDICNMLISPIKNTDDFSKIENLGFDDISLKLNVDTVKLPYSSASEKYKQACLNYAKTCWLQKEKGSIIDKDSSRISGNSAGLNAQYYLDLYTLLERKKLFIIDQPEDDVSEARISKELKTIMRRMADREQIIFVTHNAELVVNLDVNNVIVFKNDKDGKLLIKNGALEYEDDEINILNEVAELLDGGAEIIRKRWKRYDKNQRNINT